MVIFRQTKKIMLFAFLICCLLLPTQQKRLASLLEDDTTYSLDPPTFSKESGFYDNEFKLSLSVSGDASIYYTVDGSNPVTSETAKEYKEPITVQDRSKEPNIYSKYCEDMNSPISISRQCGYRGPQYLVDKAMVVRAVAKNSGGRSKVVDQTYFVTTGDLAHYKDIPVVSLVTDPENLFDPEIGIYVTGNMYIDWKNGPNFNGGKNPWDTDNICNYYMKGADWRRPASITIFEKGSVIANKNVGIGLKGASTRNNPGKSFNVLLKEKYGSTVLDCPSLLPKNNDYEGKLIDKYYSFSLRQTCETVRFRDTFATDVIRNRENITVTDMRYSALFLDGEYWGTYAITEKYSREFIESHFKIPKNNVVIINNNELEDGPEEELDKYFTFMEEYSKKDYSQQSNYGDVCKYIDVYSFVEEYASGLYLANTDWPNKNFGVWKNLGSKIEGNPYSDGRWRFTIFDFDASMGMSWGSTGDFRSMDSRKKGMPTNLFVAMLKNEEFRNLFALVLCDYANEVASKDRIKSLIDYYKSDNAEFIIDSLARWVGNLRNKMEGYAEMKSTLNQELDKINSFFGGRSNTIYQQMKNYLGLKGELQEITVTLSGKGKVKINTIVPEFSNNSWRGKYFSDTPVTLTALPSSGASFKGWKRDVESSEMTIVVSLSKSTTIEANFG